MSPVPLCLACRDLAMAPFFGNSVACRIAEAHEIQHSTLVLGDWRAAQRIQFYIGRDSGSEGEGEEEEGEAAGAGQSKQQQGQQQQQRAASRRGSSGGEASEGSSAGSAEASMGRSVVKGVGGFKVWVVNTHLDHEHQDNRQRQVGECAQRWHA